LLSQSILFLGGKGGVGKTTLSAGLALGLAEQGEKVLLLSTDPAHSISDLLDISLSDTPKEVHPGLHVRELDPERAREQYLDQVRENIRAFTQPAFLREAERQITLAGQHPGVMESAIFEALCRILDEHEDWDRIIVDTAPTGHTLHLLSLPEAMGQWTEALLSRQQPSARGQEDPQTEERWARARKVLEERRALFERTRNHLQSAASTAFLLVVQEDRLSIREGERAAAQLLKAGVSQPAILVNRVPAENLDQDWPRQDLRKAFPRELLHPLPDYRPCPMGLEGLRPISQALRGRGLI